MPIITFFSHPAFIVISGFLSILFIFTAFYTIISFFTGIWPIWVRLGMGLANRKIAIFAENKFNELKDLLVDSGIFKEKNIIQIHHADIDKAAGITLMLVYWKSFGKNIDDIISIKDDSDALIVYAPNEDGRLSPEDMNKISSKRNTVLVNFRGRLLNDITSSMITTAYKK